MFRRPLALLLIFSFVAAHFQCFFVVAGFELNRDYIAKNLCENRNRPELHCNGRCVLAKKMKQAEQKEHKEEQNNQRQRLQEVIHRETESVFFPEELLAVFEPALHAFHPTPSAPLPFHPPKHAAFTG
ncbi:MAG: hypothetical protein INR69_07565 [Mucilaginibacter polytrichastri]|nr:hypothetical protein [Mucilaginibacter polytrichastri]